MEVVESEKSMEVCIVRASGSESMSEEDIGKIVAVEKKVRDDADAAKKAKK
jgi:hypothetical protein